MPTKKRLKEILKQKKIYEILRPQLLTCGPDLAVQEAIDLMRREKSGYVVVCDDHLKVLGRFSERDVLMRVLRKGASLADPVEKYMDRNVKCLSKKDSLEAALKLMGTENIRHIPLVDDLGQLNGVLSVRTIITFFSELHPIEVFNLPPTPGQIHETAEGG